MKHIKRKTINFNYNITSITYIGILNDFCVFRVFCIGLNINKKWTPVFESKAINCTGTRVGGAISKIAKLCHSGFGSLYISMRNLIIIATSKNYGNLEILLKSCKIGRYLGKVGDREVKARVSLGGLEGMEQPTFRTYFNKCVNLDNCRPIFLQFLMPSPLPGFLNLAMWTKSFLIKEKNTFKHWLTTQRRIQNPIEDEDSCEDS